MSLDTLKISLAISKMKVTGVKIRDVTKISPKLTARDLPVLLPVPEAWFGGATIGGEGGGALTFGSSTARYWEVRKTLHYLYLHALLGAGRGIESHIPGVARNVDALIEALVELDITGVDIEGVDFSETAKLFDPNNVGYFGCMIEIRVSEQINP